MTGRAWTRGQMAKPYRDLPEDLIRALIRACDVEDSTENRGQLIRAAAATGNILYAAVCAGWSLADLGRAIGMDRSTVQLRVRNARLRHNGGPPVGLDIERPLQRPHPLAVLRPPLEEREWLTITEARAHASVSTSAMQLWLRGGLLPNSYMATGNRRLYLRADLDRILHAPKYRQHGAIHQAVRDAITEAGV